MYNVEFVGPLDRRLLKHLSKVQPVYRKKAEAVLDSLAIDPRSGLGRKHALIGDRHGTWSCTLYGGVRLLYSINDEEKRVICFDLLKTHDYGRDSLDSF